MTGLSPPLSIPALDPSDLLSVEASRIEVRIGGHAHWLNRFWLRDNCPSNGDRASLFRPFSVASMTDDLSIESAVVVDGRLELTFSDGCTDRFDVAVLATAISVDTAPTWRPFGAGHRPTEMRFSQNLADSADHHSLLDAIRRDGFCIVTGIDEGPDATSTLASWLGPIRETDFGRIFDIVSEPDPFTPSQSSSALDPHTDDPYRYHPPGISVLHCVSPCDGDGGASTITDGFAIAQSIADDDADAFRMLTTIVVPYVHKRSQSVEQGTAVDLRASAPIISVDHAGNICGIRFHERSMAPLRLDPALMDEFYRALMQFSRRALSSEFSYLRRLAAGEAVVYDNHRVLHGRTAITGASGRRHLRLCTVDRDQVHSRLRRLCASFDPLAADEPMSAGSKT